MSAPTPTASTRLAGKVAIVTGGASGLGLASCQRFAAAGAAVVCVDRDATGVDDAAAALAAAGYTAIGVSADVTDRDAMNGVAARTLEAYGQIDVLYANAGISGEGAAHRLAMDQWDRVIAINLTGVFLSVRSVLPTMMERRSGSLILQASTAALAGLANIPSYSAAKAGVLGLCRQLAVEYAPYGIRCNAICPGTILTPLVRDAFVERHGADQAPAAIAARGRDYPLGRVGTPEDVADYALFLASDESSWVTGQAHAIDGGMVAAMESPRS